MEFVRAKKRAKVEAVSKTLPIWKHFTHNKKTNSPVKRNRAKKKYKQWKCTQIELYNLAFFIFL